MRLVDRGKTAGEFPRSYQILELWPGVYVLEIWTTPESVSTHIFTAKEPDYGCQEEGIDLRGTV